MLAFMPILALAILSVNTWLEVLVVVIIAVIAFAVLWPYVVQPLGRFAPLVLGIILIIVVLIIASIFGII